MHPSPDIYDPQKNECTAFKIKNRIYPTALIFSSKFRFSPFFLKEKKEERNHFAVNAGPSIHGLAVAH